MGIEVSTVPPEYVYRTAIYIRLSVEDNDNLSDGESIAIQRYMLENYVAIHSDMQLYGVFCDNGKTGTDFERSGFEYMMEEIRQRNVDCVVVKDLSRFGRNYIEVGYYLEKIFPYLGVRFIAVNDQYDTLDKKNGEELVLSLRNLVNDWYAKDISQKISSALAVKQKNGEFIGALPPYGYLRSPKDKHKLVVDKEVAFVVQRIFQWRQEGLGLMQIARRLNQKKIPSPAMYHYQKGHRKKKPSETGSIWKAYGIKIMLQNPVYAGHMAQRKYKKSFYSKTENTMLKREDQIVVKHTHEAIIDQEIFDKVQKISKQQYQESCAKRSKYYTTENVLKGILICADCGTKMIRQKRENLSKAASYTFLCRIYRENLSQQGCIRKSVKEWEVKECMTQTLYIMMKSTVGVEGWFQSLQRQLNILKECRKQSDPMRQLQKKIKQNRTKKKSLFESYSDHTITETEYLFTKAQYKKEEQEWKKQLLELEEKESILTPFPSQQEKWFQALKEKQSEKVITRNIATELILCVQVLENHMIEIIWNFQDIWIHFAKGK